MVTTRESVQSRINAMAGSTTSRRLMVVFSSETSSASLEIPSYFTSCEIVSAARHDLHMSAESSYCGIPLASWNSPGSRNSDYELTLRSGVCVTIPNFDAQIRNSSPPFEFSNDSHVELVANNISETMRSDRPLRVSRESSKVLPWVAGLLGATAGVSTSVLMISSFKFGAWGAYVTCGSFSVAAGHVSASAVVAATAGAAVSGIIVGAAVAATVYFIPWSTLAHWMMHAWDHFLVFLKSIRSSIEVVFEMLKKFLWCILQVVLGLASAIVNTGIYVAKTALSTFFGGVPYAPNLRHAPLLI